jgi:hypothetical protein
MVRFALAGLSGVVFASAASAAFLGMEIREDKELTAEAIAEIGSDARVFNFFAKMSTDEFGDQLLNLGLRPGQDATIAINTDRHPNAQIFQTPPPFGTDIGAPNSGFFDFEPSLEFDSFASIGLKADPTGATDQTAADPDFQAVGFTDTTVSGGWFVAGFPPQGVPQFNADKGEYEVFFLQLTVTGLNPDEDGTLFQGAPGDPSASENSHFDSISSIFLADFDLFTQLGSNPENNVRTRIIVNDIPTPGAFAIFGVAGLAAARRRRA